MNVAEAVEAVRERFPFKTLWDDNRRYYVERAKVVSRYLRPGQRILDFGAGPAATVAVLQALGFRCSAFDDLKDPWHLEGDNREQILRFAASAGVAFHVDDGRGLPYGKSSFEMVAAFDVLEHLHDSPRILVNDLVDLLVPGGYLLIEVPNLVNVRKRLAVLFGRTNLPRFELYYWSPGPWRGHVREYVKGDLVELSRYAGLEIVSLRGWDGMLDKVPHGLLAPYLAVTRFVPGWKDSWCLVARKPEGWTPRKYLVEKESLDLAAAADPGARPK